MGEWAISCRRERQESPDVGPLVGPDVGPLVGSDVGPLVGPDLAQLA